MPDTLTATLEALENLRASTEVCEEVRTLVDRGVAEPIGHELFREAWPQRGANPRSALIMGVAAAESGFKECVADLVPDARWIVEHAPSPPLVEMLRDYLPTLPVRSQLLGGTVAVPDAALRELRNMVGVRNRLSHSGTGIPRRDTLESWLLTVRDVLWLLDYYRGFTWALDHVRPETLTLLDQPA